MTVISRPTLSSLGSTWDRDFDTAAPMVQGALFPKPDSMGTPALFGDAYGTDL